MSAAILSTPSLAFGQRGGVVRGSEAPAFITEPVRSSGQGTVLSVASIPEADLVLASGGYRAGFDVGMVGNLSRGGRAIARVILVEVTERGSASLILELAEGQVIRPGDRLTRSTVQTR
jgi:hypothetical protein